MLRIDVQVRHGRGERVGDIAVEQPEGVMRTAKKIKSLEELERADDHPRGNSRTDCVAPTGRRCASSH
jgi:hypothetical protein